MPLARRRAGLGGGPAGTVSQALAIFESEKVDGPLLDIRIGETDVYPVAEERGPTFGIVL